MGIIKILREHAEDIEIMQALKEEFDSIEFVSCDEDEVFTYRVQKEGISIHDKKVTVHIHKEPGIKAFITVVE